MLRCDREPSAVRRWVLAAVLSGAALASMCAVDAAGRARRTTGSAGRCGDDPISVVLVRSNADAVKLWRERGMRGRTVLHAGRFLHFVAEDSAIRALKPGHGPDADRALLAGAGARNHLWIAAATGIARRIFYVTPPASLRERLVALRRSPSDLPLDLDGEGWARTIDLEPPRLREPVLLDVNASWFDESTAADLASRLRKAGVRTDLAVLSLAEGNDDVSPGARARLRAFATELARAEPEVAP